MSSQSSNPQKPSLYEHCATEGGKAAGEGIEPNFFNGKSQETKSPGHSTTKAGHSSKIGKGGGSMTYKAGHDME